MALSVREPELDFGTDPEADIPVSTIEAFKARFAIPGTVEEIARNRAAMILCRRFAQGIARQAARGRRFIR